MGSNHSKNKINYEDVQHACNNNAFNNKNNNNGKKYAIINTMDKTWQSCLIQNTIPIQEEEEMINGILNRPQATPQFALHVDGRQIGTAVGSQMETGTAQMMNTSYKVA